MTSTSSPRKRASTTTQSYSTGTQAGARRMPSGSSHRFISVHASAPEPGRQPRRRGIFLAGRNAKDVFEVMSSRVVAREIAQGEEHEMSFGTCRKRLEGRAADPGGRDQ